MARLIKIRVPRGGPDFFSNRWRKSDWGWGWGGGRRRERGGDTSDTVKYCALLARITPVFAFSTIFVAFPSPRSVISFFFFFFAPSSWNFGGYGSFGGALE